jgi:cytochrome P450
MVARADAWADGFRAGEPRDVYADMMALTLDIAARTLFGADLVGSNGGVGRALGVVMERVKVASESFLPLPRWLPTPGNLRYLRAISALDRVCADIIRHRREQGGASADLLSMLLAARDEDDGGAMSDRQLRDEVVTLLVGGHETTAIALTFALLLLGQHPEAEAAMRAELSRVLAARPPTIADVPSLPFTDAVLKEAMRLYPPAWALSRMAVEADSLGGYHAPAGTMVAMSQWVVHRDARHFPQPDAFRPERWLEGLEQKLPRGAYFPFGGGPRLCIGVAFAQVEAKLVLARLLQRFRFEPVTEKVALMPSITLRPKHAVRMVPRAA